MCSKKVELASGLGAWVVKSFRSITIYCAVKKKRSPFIDSFLSLDTSVRQ